MDIKTSQLDGTAVVTVKGDLNTKTAPDLAKAVERLLKPGLGRLIIDFDEIRYIDSSGVGTLVSCYKQTQNNKTAFALASVSGKVCDLLKLTRLQSFFPLFRNLDEALTQMESL